MCSLEIPSVSPEFRFLAHAVGKPRTMDNRPPLWRIVPAEKWTETPHGGIRKFTP